MGIFHWPDGTKYEGNFSEGMIEGHGTETMPDGTIKTGVFRQGKMTRITAAPDYQSRYAGHIFPIKLPAEETVDKSTACRSP
jgi:hypothetical protein